MSHWPSGSLLSLLPATSSSLWLVWPSSNALVCYTPHRTILTSHSRMFCASGRRPLLLWSLVGVTLCLVMLGISFFFGVKRDTVLGGNDPTCAFDNCWDCIAQSNCGYCPDPVGGVANGTAGACLAGSNDTSPVSYVLTKPC